MPLNMLKNQAAGDDKVVFPDYRMAKRSPLAAMAPTGDDDKVVFPDYRQR